MDVPNLSSHADLAVKNIEKNYGAYQEVKHFGCYYYYCFAFIDFELRRHGFKVYYGSCCQQIMFFRFEARLKDNRIQANVYSKPTVCQYLNIQTNFCHCLSAILGILKVGYSKGSKVNGSQMLIN